MENLRPHFEELFEQSIVYPEREMQERFSMLVGLESQKSYLTKMLGLLVNPESIKEWIKKYHSSSTTIENIVLRRPPLVVLAGDVGSGKSELAYTIGDAVARQEKISITLFPLSLSTRGQGRVGQMTQLISAAFDYTIEKAKKLQSDSGKSRGAVILLVDEADALAQSRENSQMHHEDKAGVNAFIRGVDSLGNGKLPAVVIMCTNRPNALDPAIRRRAADIILFRRPNDKQRLSVLETPLKDLGFKNAEIDEAVRLTGIQQDRDYGFTYSDLVQRVLPSIILDAYPNSAVNPSQALEVIKRIVPTTPFKED